MTEEIKTYETTAEHFEYFKKECERFQRYFGLIDWKIYFKHENIDGSLGDCILNLTAKNALIRLSVDWEVEPTNHQISRVAFHEVCHILTARLLICAKSRFCSEDEIDEAEHSIVRVLENTLFKDFLSNE